MSVGFARWIAATAIAASPFTPAWGAADDTVAVQSADKRPALYLTTVDPCPEDYAGELDAAGFDVKVTRFQTLNSIGRIAQVPPDLEINHLLVLGGYVIANHVAPELITELMVTRPDIRGLVGSSVCATAGNHEAIHRERARPF